MDNTNTTNSQTANSQLIEVAKLEKSSLNVRRTDTKAACEELKASILAHGLMQNLVVTAEKKGKFQVIAGARRLAALKSLIEEGQLPADHAVQCQVVTEEHAAEMSLAENTVRVAMHPADEFEAFATLIESGKAALDVAERFGATERHVLQRMKLARVAPKLLQEYRAEKLTLESLMAFTVTDDQAKQIAAFEGLDEWDLKRPGSIRRALTGETPTAKSKLATFVGLEVYEAAGGKTRTDLFGEDIYLEDSVLLHRLAGDKLEAEAATLRNEGWAWVETAFERDWQLVNDLDEIEPQPVDVPQELADQKTAIEAEIESLETEWDEADDDDDELLDGIRKRNEDAESRLEAVEEKIEALARFTPEQMAVAGCYAYIHHDGTLEIDKGLVKPQDAKKAAAAIGVDSDDEDDDTPAEKPKGMSETLKRDLEAYRLAAAQAEIAKHPAIAFDLLVFKAAKGLLSHGHARDGADIAFRQNHGGMGISGEAKAALGQQVDAMQADLSREWLDESTEAEQFAAFQQLTDTDKHQLLAYCVAVTLQPKLAPTSSDRITAYDVALSQTGANVADYWRPSAANYLSRITRDQLLEIGGELGGAKWSAIKGTGNKRQLVAELDGYFATPPDDKVKNWLPKGMEFPAIETPAPAEQKRKPGRPKKQMNAVRL